MRLAQPLSLVPLALMAVGIAACGPSLNGKRLKPPSFVDDVDPERARVSISKKASAPMTVDWKSENRAALEVSARRGIAVVKFDPKNFELLPQCHAPGAYTYVGVTAKRDHMRIESRAELHANMPFGAFKLEGKLEDSGVLSVVMRTVGMKILDRPGVTASDLQGRCEGATHYVESLTVGAFRFAAGAARNAGAEATVMGKGAKGEVRDSTETLEEDGVFTDCDAADPSATTSPKNCSGILRIEIVPLTPTGEAAQTKTASAPACGDGMRWNGSGCVSMARVQAEEKKSPAEDPGAAASEGRTGGFECDPKNADECRTQCRHGNLASCVVMGHYSRYGSGVPKDHDKAQKLYAVACKAGQATGCTALADLFLEQGKFGEALALGKSACLSGDPAGCNSVAVQAFFGRGVKEDRGVAFQLWVRACALRDWSACSNAGVVLSQGMGGVAKDEVRARKLYQLACESPIKDCSNYAGAQELGIGGPASFEGAMKLYLEGCERNSASSCTNAGLLAEEKGGKPEHRAKALGFFEKSCGFVETGGCLSEKEMREGYAGKYTEEGLIRRSCDGAPQPALGCYNAAIGHERGYGGRIDLDKAGVFLKKACDAGLKRACRAARPEPRRAPGTSDGTTPL